MSVREESYRWLGYFLPWATMVVLLAAYFYHGETGHELQRIRAADSAVVHVGADMLTRSLRRVGEDLLILAGDADFARTLEAPEPASTAALTDDFLNFARTRRVYDRICWLDAGGRERLCVRGGPGGPEVVAPAQLRRAAEPQPVAAAMAFAPGEFHVSRIELSVADGRVESPPKPLIRIATPVTDRRGERRGLLVIDYLAADMLARFRTHVGRGESRGMLVDDAGHLLVSPGRDEDWNITPRRGNSFAARYPAAWARIKADGRGQFEDGDGLWTFETVATTIDNGRPAAAANPAGSGAWTVVAMLPEAERHLIRLHRLPQTLVVTAVALLVILFGSWRLAATRTRQIAAEEELRQSNVNLEHSVEDRTRQLRSEVAERQLAERRYRESSEQYQRILATMRDGYLLFDRTGAVLDVNAASCEMLGYSRDELLNLKIADIEAGESPPEVIVHIEKIAATGYDRYESQYRGKADNIVDVEISVALVAEYQRFVAIVRNISERKRVEAERRLAGLVFENTDEGLLVCGADLRVRSVNPAFSRITGYPAEAIVGRSPALLQVSPDGPAFEEFVGEVMRQLQRSGSWRGEVRARRKNGELFPAWLNISVVRDARQRIELYVAVFSDITTIKAAQEHLDFLAHHDALTGLPNRLLLNARFEHSIERARRESRRLALLFLDLDRFKEVNDTLGHAVGDRLLKDLATALSERLRGEDTLARLGGDEFVILLEDVGDRGSIESVLDKLSEIFPWPVPVPGGRIDVTASIGVSIFPEHGSDADTLLRQADIAMYRAKEGGRARHVYAGAEAAAAGAG